MYKPTSHYHEYQALGATLIKAGRHHLHPEKFPEEARTFSKTLLQEARNCIRLTPELAFHPNKMDIAELILLEILGIGGCGELSRLGIVNFFKEGAESRFDISSLRIILGKKRAAAQPYNDHTILVISEKASELDKHEIYHTGTMQGFLVVDMADKIFFTISPRTSLRAGMRKHPGNYLYRDFLSNDEVTVNDFQLKEITAFNATERLEQTRQLLQGNPLSHFLGSTSPTLNFVTSCREALIINKIFEPEALVMLCGICDNRRFDSIRGLLNKGETVAARSQVNALTTYGPVKK